MALLLRQSGAGRVQLQVGVGRLQLQPALTDADLPTSATLWSLEPGRFLDAIEPGRFLYSLEPGRFVTMPANAGPYDLIGKLYLAAGGSTGGKRRFGVHFANMEEIVAGDTLTGTPIVTVAGSPTYPAITSPAVSGSDVLFTVNAGTAVAGEHLLSIHVATSGGAILECLVTLVLEDSR